MQRIEKYKIEKMIQRKFRTSWKVGKLQSQHVIWNLGLVNCVTKFSLKWNFWVFSTWEYFGNLKGNLILGIRLHIYSFLFWSGKSVKIEFNRIEQASYLKTYWDISSIGIGKTMVEFFSEEMVARVWRYLSCRAAGLSEMMSLASFRALLAFCSPSAAITYNSSLCSCQEWQVFFLPWL